MSDTPSPGTTPLPTAEEVRGILKDYPLREPEYTREEMREACRNTWNAALDRAAQQASDMGYPDAACSIRDLKETV